MRRHRHDLDDVGACDPAHYDRPQPVHHRHIGDELHGSGALPDVVGVDQIVRAVRVEDDTEQGHGIHLVLLGAPMTDGAPSGSTLLRGPRYAPHIQMRNAVEDVP